MKNNPKAFPPFVIVILLLAFSLRLYYSLVAHPISGFIFSDMQNYYGTAERLIDGNTELQNIFYPPGYSILIAFLIKAFPTQAINLLAVLQSAIGTITIYLFFRLSQKILRPHYANLFLLGLALYFPFIDYSGYLLSETLATFMLVLPIWICVTFINYRRYFWLFACVIVLGLGSLIRANIWLTGTLIIIWSLCYLWIKANFHFRKMIKPLLVTLCGFITSLCLTGLVYFQAGGKIDFTSLNGGLNFMQGQCLIGHATDINGWAFGPPIFMQRNLHAVKTFPEAFLNSSYFYLEGLSCLSAYPVRILQKPLENYYMFFGNTAWPSSDQPRFSILMSTSHALFNLFVLPGLLLSLILRPLIGRKYHFLLWLIIVSSLITSIIFYADIRYRIPYDGFYILLAFWGYSGASSYLQSRLRRG